MDLRLKLAITVSKIKDSGNKNSIDVIMYKALCDIIDADIMGQELKLFLRDLQIELIKMMVNTDGTINKKRLDRAINFMIGVDKMFEEELYQFMLN